MTVFNPINPIKRPLNNSFKISDNRTQVIIIDSRFNPEIWDMTLKTQRLLLSCTKLNLSEGI